MPENGDDYFGWLLSQPPDIVLKLLSFVTALGVKGVYSSEPERQGNDDLAEALRLDMNHWWAVRGDNYLDHVPKSRIAEVVSQVAGADEAARLAALKKADAVAAAEQLLAGKGWLPGLLRVGSRGQFEAAPGHTASADEQSTAVPDMTSAE